jgi:hypothetical protein
MPKLEINIRVTTPPLSKNQDPIIISPTAMVLAKSPTTTTTPLRKPDNSAITVPPTSRIDSGFDQKRASNTDKPLPVLDRTRERLDEHPGSQRNSSAGELADWLALSKMMENM